MSASSSYSNPRSGTSSPRGSSSATPPPAATSDGPSPLMVGTRFVKQYYQVLTSDAPEQIVKFYQPSSVISKGTASQTSTATPAPERFPRNARFEFEHGAIDAQTTGINGILLVVTGQVFFNTSNAEEEDAGALRCQAFVHTFVLQAISNAQGKRSYYVQNDILRFLNENLTAQTTGDSLDAVAEPAAARKEVIEEETVVVSNKTAIQVMESENASGGGVEESKDSVLDDDVSKEVAAKGSEKNVPVVVVVEETSMATVEIPVPADARQGKKDQAAGTEGGENGKSAPKSGSWASLVARAPAPSTPAKVSPQSPAKTKTTEPDAADSQVTAASSSQVTGQAKATVPAKTAPSTTATGPTPVSKRDPDFTLVIKNITGQAKEPDVIAMFESFAKQTDATIVSITVAAHKGIAFIDFSSAAPVLAIVEKHKQEAFQLHGKELDVYQKSIEQRSRRGAGGRGPSGTGGGRQHRGGRSERGSGRGGRGGR